MVAAKRGKKGNTKAHTAMQFEEWGVNGKIDGIISKGAYINLVDPILSYNLGGRQGRWAL